MIRPKPKANPVTSVGSEKTNLEGFAKRHGSSEALHDILEMRDVNLSARIYSIAGKLHLVGLIPRSFLKKKPGMSPSAQKLGSLDKVGA